MPANPPVRLLVPPLNSAAPSPQCAGKFPWGNAMNLAWRYRLRAGGIHFGISLVVALLTILFVYGVWYPGALSALQGVSHIVLIMLGVDVALGPLLTTVVFRPGKSLRALRFDLTLIGLAQLAALIYGVHTVASGRPAYLVFNIDRVDVVAVSDIDPASQQRARLQGAPGVSWFGPLTVAARLPEDRALRSQLTEAAMEGGPDLAQRPEWYLPFQQEREAVLEASQPIERLRKAEMDAATEAGLLGRYGREAAALRYLPLVGKERDGVAIIDAATGDLLGFEALQPVWKSARR